MIYACTVIWFKRFLMFQCGQATFGTHFEMEKAIFKCIWMKVDTDLVKRSRRFRVNNPLNIWRTRKCCIDIPWSWHESWLVCPFLGILFQLILRDDLYLLWKAIHTLLAFSLDEAAGTLRPGAGGGDGHGQRGLVLLDGHLVDGPLILLVTGRPVGMVGRGYHHSLLLMGIVNTRLWANIRQTCNEVEFRQMASAFLSLQLKTCISYTGPYDILISLFDVLI